MVNDIKGGCRSSQGVFFYLKNELIDEKEPLGRKKELEIVIQRFLSVIIDIIISLINLLQIHISKRTRIKMKK